MANRTSVGASSEPDELDWMFQYSLAATASAAMGLGPSPEGALATAALAVANHSGSVGAGRGEWIAYPGTLFAVGFMGREMRRSARDLGASRKIALDLTREQATARERLRQHRLLHDSALQTLEAAVSHWDELGEAIQERAAIEATELRKAQLGRAENRYDLTTLLRALEDQFASLGLDVSLETHHKTIHGKPSEQVSAVADAVHEALVNVRKHAGVAAAAIETASDDRGLLVTVADGGSGFDPDEIADTLGGCAPDTRPPAALPHRGGAPTPPQALDAHRQRKVDSGWQAPRRMGGFGIKGSIHHRLEEVGGTAQILSRPGKGTRVIIRCDIPTGDPAESGAKR